MRFTLRLMVFVTLMLGAIPSRAIALPSIVVDVNTGGVLHANEAFHPWYPASLTKLMTAYTTYHAISTGQINLQTKVKISAAASRQPPSKIGLKPGSTVTVETALYMTMVKSANDMAYALAETVGGNHDNFIKRMNFHAKRLGMVDTTFTNPHGLPDTGQVTTARDLAVLALAVLNDFPQYDHFHNTKAIQLGKKVMKNYNHLLGRYPGANGMKTGFICASGFNLIATAKRGRRHLMAIVLGEQSGNDRALAAARLFETYFDTAPSDRGWFGNAPTKLYTLRRPYDTPHTTTDMREKICSPASRQARNTARSDDEGDDEEANLLKGDHEINSFFLQNKGDIKHKRLLGPKLKDFPVVVLGLGDTKPQVMRKGANADKFAQEAMFETIYNIPYPKVRPTRFPRPIPENAHNPTPSQNAGAIPVKRNQLY